MGIEVSLFALTDATQVPLTYSKGTITGKANASVSLPTGLKLKLPITVKASFISTHVGVLLHVVGELYVVAAYYPPTGAVAVLLLDGSKIDGGPESTIGATSDFVSIVDRLRPSITCAYARRGSEWNVLSIKK